jgi:hypothetical protein
MKLIIDQNRINRNALFSNAASVGGLLLLLASVVLPLFLPGLATLSSILMVIGLGTSMVGIYFANRWVRKPRPEDRLNQELKGLGDTYAIYHYPRLPVDHILLTPVGIYVIETIGLGGAFRYQDGKWKESMTIGRALRYIVEEHLGNPTWAAQSGVEYLQRLLCAHSEDFAGIPVKPLVVFTHPAALVEAKGSPVPVCLAGKLRKQISTTGPKIKDDLYAELQDYLESITR